jgi:thiol-disulfide isomerase/thioredoxin
MNQKLIIGIISLVVIAGGALIYSSSTSTETMVAVEQENMMKEDVMVADSEDAMIKKDGEAMADAGDVMKKDAEDITMKKDADVMINTGNVTVKNDTAMTDIKEVMQKVGSYESYDASKVAMASATNDVVLFFRASWCPKCTALDKNIKANLNAIPENLTILDTNYDNSADLKRKYGVTLQHTFVQVDADGNLIKKWSGSPTLASLVSEVK